MGMLRVIPRAIYKIPDHRPFGGPLDTVAFPCTAYRYMLEGCRHFLSGAEICLVLHPCGYSALQNRSC